MLAPQGHDMAYPFLINKLQGLSSWAHSIRMGEGSQPNVSAPGFSEWAVRQYSCVF